jgi:LasA protease
MARLGSEAGKSWELKYLGDRFGTIILMVRRIVICVLFFSVWISACVPGQSSTSAYPTYNPFLPLQGSTLASPASGTFVPSATRTPGPTPTFAPLAVTLAVHTVNSPLTSPTPDIFRTLPTPRQSTNQYTVQVGDTLGSIAQAFGVSVDTLVQANSLVDANALSVGQVLTIPAPVPGSPGSSFKIIPDSELVYGPASAQFDYGQFIQNQGGYLATYTQDINGETFSGAEIITQVSQDYSVNPRLLLALLEYRSKWVTRPNPDGSTLNYPLGFVEQNHTGLYHQLTWAANELNRGFYLWSANAVGNWVLGDGSVVPVDPTINSGTAGVQDLFAILDDRTTWDTDVNAFGLFQAYYFMFGNPFDLAVEPLIPLQLLQPRMDLPFEPGAVWAFTGGPHAGWDSGSAWAALDFAPSDVQGCAVSAKWVTAAVDGFIIRAKNGAVMQDLDGDGYEQTGWDVLYMHVASEGRVAAGTYVYAGDRIGHPSCEGGLANAAHLHIARKYNGVWISADRSLPFILGGWVSSGLGIEYDGYLKRGASTLQAAEGISELNQISR